MAAEEVQLKGQAFKGFMGAVARLFGEKAERDVVAGLPPNLRATWTNGGIVTGGFYPIAWYRGFHVAAAAALKGEPLLAKRISYEATRHDMQGIYRFVLRWVSPHTLIGQAPRILALYQRGGSVSVRDNHEGSVTLAYEDCHGYNGRIWQDVTGGTEATLETTRVKVISSLVLEGGGDGPRMICRFRWEAARKQDAAQA